MFALLVLPVFSSYAAEQQPPPTAAPPAATGKPAQATPALPDLIVERVWLDKEGFINFQLKNAGQAEIPNREHRQGMVRVTYGRNHKDFSFRKTLKKRPPVDPKGLLKKPGGVVPYNTQIRVKERLTITVVVDCTKRIAEANEQNNQGISLGLAALKDVREKTAEQVKPTPPPEAMQEITQREEIRTLEGGEPGRGGEHDPDLEIESFDILAGPIIPVPGSIEVDRDWGNRATYTYNGSGEYEEYEDIKFRVRVLNQGGDFEGAIGIKIYSWPAQVSHITPLVTLPEGGESGYFEVTLHQSELIERDHLSPGTHEFSAEITYHDADLIRRTGTSFDGVTLNLRRPTPRVEAIPIETITLPVQGSLTGSVSNRGDTTNSFIQVGNFGSGSARGFLSFDLSAILRELLRRGYRCTEFEIRSATLEIEEYQILAFDPGEHSWSGWGMRSVGEIPEPMACSGSIPSWHHRAVGTILLDFLEGYDALTSGIFNADMITNLLTFQSTCGVHSFPNFDAYVRFQLERGETKIQFRLRLAGEGGVTSGPDWTFVHSIFFRNPRLIVRVTPVE
jgi:hypothetical protein